MLHAQKTIMGLIVHISVNQSLGNMTVLNMVTDYVSQVG